MKDNEIMTAQELHACFACTPEMRPCIVRTKDGEKKAIFHRWEQRVEAVMPDGNAGSGNSECFGIVELEGGKVVRRYPGQITFVDDMVRQVWDESATTVAEGADYV